MYVSNRWIGDTDMLVGYNSLFSRMGGGGGGGYDALILNPNCAEME